VTEPVLLAFGDREHTRSELDALTSGMAAVLEQRGVRAGDRVALMSSNRPEFVVAMRAIWGVGAAVVLLSSAWKRAEVEHALALTAPAHAVGDHPVLAEAMPMLHLDDAVAPRAGKLATPDPDADALFVFSSGTTGMPKAARHTHRAFAVAVAHWRAALELSSTDRMQIMTPPSHILGLLNIATALDAGAWIRLHPRFDIDTMLRGFPAQEGFWQRFTEAVAQHGLAQPVAFGLALAQRTLATPIYAASGIFGLGLRMRAR